MRQQRSLHGTWQFQLDPDGQLTPADLVPERDIPVPLAWQAADPTLAQYSGYAWYRRTFTLDQADLVGEVLLQFGAVDYWCQVFVNGQLAGEHEGGYTPFTVAVGAHVQPGVNELAVRVYDSVQHQIITPRWPAEQPAPESGGPPFEARDVPHGKQEWYINIGGIWQDVMLLCVPSTFISQLHVTPNIHTGEAAMAVTLAGAAIETHRGALAISVEQGGRTLAAARLALAPGQMSYQAILTINDPQLWQLDDPALYTAVAQLLPDGSAVADELRARFGFREIGTRDGQITLNGEPIYLLAALDQDLYPDTISSAPSEAFLRDQFQKAKHLGMNCLRSHIKPPEPLYLNLADEIGLLVWAEIPSWRTFTIKETVHPATLHLSDRIKARAEQTLAEMIQRDYNHPSLVIWTLVNEDWGTALPLSAADRAWVRHLYARCKQLDPTRLVVDNSACLHEWGPNVHVQSDLDDFHIYTNIPDAAGLFEQFVEQFSLRPAWSYSQHGDAQRTGQEPLVLSEFGNWGLPSVRGLCDADGQEPAWFDIGPWWSPWEGAGGWARGVVQRFARLGLDTIWPDYEAFATATQWHAFNALKFEIETMRRKQALAGYVVTELTDIYWESNGLLDFHRQPKVFHDRFATINAPDVVIPQPSSYACWDDQTLPVQIHGSHYSRADWRDTRLSWTSGGSTTQSSDALPPLAQGRVGLLTSAAWRMPQVAHARIARFDVALENADSEQLARNILDILVMPAHTRWAAHTAPLAVVGDAQPFGSAAAQHPALAQVLSSLGYQASVHLATDTQIAVTAAPTPELLEWVRAGGSLLFLCQGPSPFFWAQGRNGPYAGNWMSSWSWIRPEMHRRLPHANPLGLPFRQVMPTHVIVGLPVEDTVVQSDFLAGMIVGWVRHPAVHTVQFRYGTGKVIMTTFALAAGLGADPVATAMFHDLIDHLASAACQPRLRAR